MLINQTTTQYKVTLNQNRLKDTMAPLPLHRAPVGAYYLHLDPLEHQKSVYRGEGKFTINNALLDELRKKSPRLDFTF